MAIKGNWCTVKHYMKTIKKKIFWIIIVETFWYGNQQKTSGCNYIANFLQSKLRESSTFYMNMEIITEFVYFEVSIFIFTESVAIHWLKTGVFHIKKSMLSGPYTGIFFGCGSLIFVLIQMLVPSLEIVLK